MTEMHTHKTTAEPVNQEHHERDWSFMTRKSHILQSVGPERQTFESDLELPQTPEMIFADNFLTVEHSSGAGLTFSALDALRLVDAKHDLVKVAVSQAWLESRLEDAPTMEVVNPFDWTYTTNYKGSLYGSKENNSQFKVSEDRERINIERLKQREKILFYDDVVLFEDELSDNGSSTLRVKIRVMPSGFFILLRFFMRVDDVIVRLNETRFHHQFDSDYVIREYTSKDENVENIPVTRVYRSAADQLTTEIKPMSLPLTYIVVIHSAIDLAKNL